jgi:hypothetical protein
MPQLLVAGKVLVATTNLLFNSSWVGGLEGKAHGEKQRSPWLPRPNPEHPR